MGGIRNKVQVGDMGVDGRIFQVGRPNIDQFCHVMVREDRQRGFFVAFGFSSDAERECSAFHKNSG